MAQEEKSAEDLKMEQDIQELLQMYNEMSEDEKAHVTGMLDKVIKKMSGEDEKNKKE